MGEILWLVGISDGKGLSNEFSHPPRCGGFVCAQSWPRSCGSRELCTRRTCMAKHSSKPCKKADTFWSCGTRVHRARCLTSRRRIPITPSPNANWIKEDGRARLPLGKALRDLRIPIGNVLSPRVRTALFRLSVISAWAPHPIQMHRQHPRHRYLRDSSSSAPGRGGKNLLRHCRWVCIVTCATSTSRKRSSESPCLLLCRRPAIAAGFFRWNQNHIVIAGIR